MDEESPLENHMASLVHLVQLLLLTGQYNLIEINFYPLPSECKTFAWRKILN